MNLSRLIVNCMGMLLILLIFVLVFCNTFASAGEVYDVWDDLREFQTCSALYQTLSENSWIGDEIALQELDHILVLVEQVHDETFPDVSVALILAVISVESLFREDCHGTSDDSGLMQVIPRYHQQRIEKYVYSPTVDIFDPLVNIETGTDYLNDLLTQTKGDLTATLMCYNEGCRRACKRYYQEGTTSKYAIKVITRMEKIQDVLDRAARGVKPYGQETSTIEEY